MKKEPPTPGDGSATASRRRFLATGVTLASAALATAQFSDSTNIVTDDGPSEPVGMVIDLNRCTGCQACAVACKAEHGVRLGGFRSWVSELETGTYPVTSREFLPRLCNHCSNAPCQKVCPTGATSRRPNGTVTIDNDRCIGCRHCMVACPYNARYFNPQHDSPDLQKRHPARTRGTVDKCDFCVARVSAGAPPACVETCPNSARVFGTTAEIEDRLGPSVGGRMKPLLAELGTKPSVRYVSGNPDAFEQQKERNVT